MQTIEDPSIAMIIGNSPQIVDLKAAIVKVAPRNTTVLLTGDTGTGKELFAQAIHQGSLRRYKPFVRVNCAAIPEALLESELFGYAAGTFTGAKKGGYIGKFAQADGGTVFLDEVTELPYHLQSKLLRFLQEHEIQRLGESYPRQVNVRIVAATNANLPQLVKYKKFRADLFYRLNVVAIEIPPLRNRREDILPLCRNFIMRLNDEFNYRIYHLHPKVQGLLTSYNWPGNVRELENALEAAFNLCDGKEVLRLEHLPQYLRHWYEQHVGNFAHPTEADALPQVQDRGGNDADFHSWSNYVNSIGKYSLNEIVNKVESDILQYVLGQEKNRSRVATVLGLSRPALYKKMAKYSLR